MSRFENKQTGLLTLLDYKSDRIRILYWLCFFVMIAIALVCFIPPIWILLSSLKDVKEFYSVPVTIIPKTFRPEKLVNLWNKMEFIKYYMNSLYEAIGCIFFAVICNSLIGYSLSRLKPVGSSFLCKLMLWTMLIPNSVAIVPLYKNIIDLPILHINLSNSFVPLWFFAGANAFYVLVFKSFFDSISISLIEAARLDGCSNMDIYRRIMIPLSKPVIIVITIFTFNSSWSNFLWPYIIIRDVDLYTVMVRIFTMSTSDSGYTMDMQMVAILFAIIPPAILFLLFQKHIMQGFTLSGIKE